MAWKIWLANVDHIYMIAKYTGENLNIVNIFIQDLNGINFIYIYTQLTFTHLLYCLAEWFQNINMQH